jgi:hypothetical protein
VAEGRRGENMAVKLGREGKELSLASRNTDRDERVGLTLTGCREIASKQGNEVKSMRPSSFAEREEREERMKKKENKIERKGIYGDGKVARKVSNGEEFEQEKLCLGRLEF